MNFSILPQLLLQHSPSRSEFDSNRLAVQFSPRCCCCCWCCRPSRRNATRIRTIERYRSLQPMVRHPPTKPWRHGITCDRRCMPVDSDDAIGPIYDVEFHWRPNAMMKTKMEWTISMKGNLWYEFGILECHFNDALGLVVWTSFKVKL